MVTRWLAQPTNMTLDTISDLLLGMGGEPDFRFFNFTVPRAAKEGSSAGEKTVHVHKGKPSLKLVVNNNQDDVMRLDSALGLAVPCGSQRSTNTVVALSA